MCRAGGLTNPVRNLLESHAASLLISAQLVEHVVCQIPNCWAAMQHENKQSLEFGPRDDLNRENKQ